MKSPPVKFTTNRDDRMEIYMENLNCALHELWRIRTHIVATAKKGASIESAH